MNRFVFHTLLFSLPMIVLGCTGAEPQKPRIVGSGKKMTSTREVDDFTAVEMTTFGEVKITVGEAKSVNVDIDDNLTEIIETKVEKGKLSVRANGRFTSGIGPVVNIMTPKLERIDLVGMGSISVREMSGEKLIMSLPGSGNITVEGEVDLVDVDSRGSGNIELRKLKAKSVAIKLSGSGNANVNAEESIDIHLSGSGVINVLGNPKDIKQKVTGSGLVEINK